jgi:hypothetical protein
MAFEQQRAAALRILRGLEEGTMTAAQSTDLVEDADPALVYLIFTWIRRRYADDPNADAVVGRLLAVLDRKPAVALKLKEGQSDPVVQWFEEEHAYREFGAEDFIETIVDKLEG